KDDQLFAGREPYFLAEDVVLQAPNFFQQIAVDGGENPQRRLAVLVNHQDQSIRGKIIFARPVCLQLQKRADLRRVRRSAEVFRRDMKLGQIFLGKIDPAHLQIFLYVANNIGELEG